MDSKKYDLMQVIRESGFTTLDQAKELASFLIDEQHEKGRKLNAEEMYMVFRNTGFVTKDQSCELTDLVLGYLALQRTCILCDQGIPHSSCDDN